MYGTSSNGGNEFEGFEGLDLFEGLDGFDLFDGFDLICLMGLTCWNIAYLIKKPLLCGATVFFIQ
jgi:hypothetical protein